MAPPLIVRAVLDAAGYLKMSDSVVSANTLMGDTALGMGADFTKSAEAQVAASAKVIASNRAQLASLEAVQKATVAGSNERIAADVAVAKANAVLARSTGGVLGSTVALSGGAKTAERDLGKLSRGALAGSGVFSALGRSLAFASTGFIAVAGGSTLIAESIRQAEGLAAAQRQVDQQLKTSGKSWATYGTRIDSVLLKEGHLAGFTRAQLLQAFGYLLRVGGNVQRSLQLTGLAADVARGRSISLQAASIALSKALGGSATALRRLGIIVPNNVTKMQALEYVQKKFAGQALAGTTVSERFSASLSDAGATIGTALLPTFDRLVGHFGDWLQRMNASGKLTQDVNTGVHLLGIGFHTLEDAISVVDKVTGGFGHTLLLIGEIWAGIKIAAWIGTLEKVAISWGLIQSAAEKAAAAEAAAASVSAAGIATGDLRAAALASEGAGGAGLLSRLVPRGVGGAVGLGVGGLIAGQLAERAIPGQAGQTTGRALEGAGVGAGIGLLVGGPVGAGVGGALGGLVGAVSTFIHSAPTFNQQATTMAHSITALGHAGQIASRDILALQSSIATGRVSRDEAQQALKQAQAQEQATRGTSAHAAAVDRLRAAQLNLRVANESLVVSQEKLTAAQKRQADTQERQRKATAAFAVQLQSIAKQSQTIPGPRGLPFPNADPFGTYIDKLRSLQGELVKTDPKMAKVIANLLAIAQMFGKIPSSKTVKLTLQETLAGTFQLPRIGPGGDLFPRGPRSVPSGPTGPTGPAGKPPVVQWSQFQLTLTEQVLQAKAALTKTTADDVAVAKQIIARIKNLIARGKLDDKALIQALQAEADAQSTIDSAAQARRDAAAKAAAVAKARASTYNVPAALQLAQAKAEAYGKSETAILKKIIAAAQKAINSGGKNWQGLVAAYQTIANARAQLEQDAQQALIPLKLQLALARAQATGGDQTPILRKMKAVLEKALKAAKGNIQKQIDIWTQIGAINQQLGQDISNSYGDYKKASLKWETQGLGLTPAQRRALEARLSQIGPGGTHPMSGTGAAGYIIDPDTGRPIHRNQRRRQGSQYSRSGSGTPTVNANIDLRVYIDGKQVEAVVTKRQQKNNTRRPTQSRGPNAATR